MLRSALTGRSTRAPSSASFAENLGSGTKTSEDFWVVVKY